MLIAAKIEVATLSLHQAAPSIQPGEAVNLMVAFLSKRKIKIQTHSKTIVHINTANLQYNKT
jgi:hypothetical protein